MVTAGGDFDVARDGKKYRKGRSKRSLRRKEVYGVRGTMYIIQQEVQRYWYKRILRREK